MPNKKKTTKFVILENIPVKNHIYRITLEVDDEHYQNIKDEIELYGYITKEEIEIDI